MTRGSTIARMLIIVSLTLGAVARSTVGAWPTHQTDRSDQVVRQLRVVDTPIVDPATSRHRYRVAGAPTGQVVQESVDAGATWNVILTPFSSPATRTTAINVARLAEGSSCIPANYTAVHTLVPSTAPDRQLYIASQGAIGSYLDHGCDSTVGGIYVQSATGTISSLGHQGLPFAQDPVGRTIRAYDVDTLIAPAHQSAVLYVHAGPGSGPFSPPEGLYRSLDGGQTWNEIDTGIVPSQVISNSVGMAVPAYSSGTLTVATSDPSQLTFRNDSGSYQSTDGGSIWQPFGATALPPPTNSPTQTALPTPTIDGSTTRQSVIRPHDMSVPAGWAWSQITPNNAPPLGRQDAALDWDSSNRQLLVFGGTNASSSQNMADLWSYIPSTNLWTQLAGGPPGRFGAATAWDPVDGVLLLYGGQNSTGTAASFLGDLWAYHPGTNSWTQLWSSNAANGPASRSHAVVTWDSMDNRLLIFGGETSDSPWQATNDLWAFTPTADATGGTWTLLSAANSGCTITCPSFRASALGAWDSQAGLLRVFGGRSAMQSTILSDTWSWTPTGASGGTWNEENRLSQPAGRAEGAVAYDATHAAVVIGPGLSLARGSVDDAWVDEAGAQLWRPLGVVPAPVPPLRRLTNWVWDGNEFLLFGGHMVGGVGAANDLWAFGPSNAAATPTAQPTSTIVPGLDEGQVLDAAGNVLVTDRQIATTNQAGARYVRINFRLGNATDWTNQTLLASYDAVVNRYHAAGIQVLGLVNQEATHSAQSDWTANNHEVLGGSGDNSFISTTYVQNALIPLIQHFHDRVKLWELWNEPNAYSQCSGTSCSGGSFIYPSNFAALLVDSYTAIKYPPPGAPSFAGVDLISGGLLGQSIGGVLSTTSAGADYLKSTFTMGLTYGAWRAFANNHGGSYPLDGLGQHLYIDQNLLTTSTDLGAYYGWVRGAAAAFETPQPTYLTEGAWNTNAVPQPLQATNLDLLFSTTRTMGYVPQATWFELQDLPQNNLFFGLISTTGKKPSFNHYQLQAAISVPSDATATARVSASRAASAEL